MKKDYNIKKGVVKLYKFIKDKNDKHKKDTFDELKNNNIAKSAGNLEDLINNKFKKNTFDELKKIDDIVKGTEKLDNLLNNKLKDNTFKKLKTMDSVDV